VPDKTLAQFMAEVRREYPKPNLMNNDDYKQYLYELATPLFNAYLAEQRVLWVAEHVSPNVPVYERVPGFSFRKCMGEYGNVEKCRELERAFLLVHPRRYEDGEHTKQNDSQTRLRRVKGR
jgi:hypothetical protein